MLSQDSEDEIRSRFTFELAIWLWKDELNPRVRCAFGNVSIYPSSGQCIVTVFHMSINILMLETVSEGVVIAHIPAATHISFIRRPSSKMLLVKNPFFFWASLASLALLSMWIYCEMSIFRQSWYRLSRNFWCHWPKMKKGKLSMCASAIYMCILCRNSHWWRLKKVFSIPS